MSSFSSTSIFRFVKSTCRILPLYPKAMASLLTPTYDQHEAYVVAVLQPAFVHLLSAKKTSLVHHDLNGRIQLAFPVEEHRSVLDTEAPGQLVHEIRNR